MGAGIKMVLVGDEGAGKTSLMTTLVSDLFPAQVPRVMHAVQVRPEITPDNVELTIYDTSSDVQHRDETDRKLREACDVVILVCAASSELAMERVSSFWLPRFLSLGLQDIPVVLALSKFDELDVPRGVHARRFANLVGQKRIATCIEVSARDKRNVADVFCWAQKAVTYPVSPLYDAKAMTLRCDYKKALVRIFRLCDRDADEILNDEELRQFQRSVFEVELSINDVHAIKSALLARNEENLAVEHGGITFEGFCCLQRMFIEKNKMDTPWIVLRHFGYNSSLALSNEYIPDPPLRKIDQAYELTSTGSMIFLYNIFQRFDRDYDGALNATELKSAFFAAPNVPFPAGYEQNVSTLADGSLTLPGWISCWGMLVFFEPRKAMQYLLYLGCPVEEVSRCIQVTEPKFKDRRRDFVDRETIHCLVFGSPRCGKTAFVRGLIGKQPPAQHVPTHELNTVAQLVEVDPHGDGEKTTRVMILTEVSSTEEVTLETIEEDVPRCDLVLLLFDQSNPHSLAYVKDLLEKRLPHYVPHVLIATKCDKPFVEQIDPFSEDIIDPVAFGAEYDISIEQCSAFSDALPSLFPRLVETAIMPNASIPKTSSSRRNTRVLKFLKRTMVLTMVSALTFYVGSRIYSWSSTHRNGSSTMKAASSPNNRDGIHAHTPTSTTRVE